MLVYLSVAGMWVFKAHHIFSLHFVCFFFNVKLWSLGACYTPTMAWKGVVSRLLRAGSHTVAVCFSYGIFVGPWKWATSEMAGRKDPVCFDHPWWSQKCLNGWGRSAKGWKQKYWKICLGRDHSDQMIKQTPLPHWRGTLHLNSLLSAKMETCTRQGHGRLVPLSSLVPWKKHGRFSLENLGASKKLPGTLYFKLTAGWVALKDLPHQLWEVQTCTSRQSPLSKMAINGPSSGGGQRTTDEGNRDFAHPCFLNSFPCRWFSLRIYLAFQTVARAAQTLLGSMLFQLPRVESKRSTAGTMQGWISSV